MDENKNKGMNVDFEENMNFGKVDKSYQICQLCPDPLKLEYGHCKENNTYQPHLGQN